MRNIAPIDRNARHIDLPDDESRTVEGPKKSDPLRLRLPSSVVYNGLHVWRRPFRAGGDLHLTGKDRLVPRIDEEIVAASSPLSANLGLSARKRPIGSRLELAVNPTLESSAQRSLV